MHCWRLMSNNKDVIILSYSLKNRLFWADIQFTNDSEQKTKLPTGTKYEQKSCMPESNETIIRRYWHIQCGPKKWGHKLVAIISSNHNRFSYFFTAGFFGKLAVSRLLKIRPLLACCHTALWNINVTKQAINDELQGSVATYVKCGGVVNNQIKKCLLLSLSVIFKSVNISQSYKQGRGCFVHFARLATTHNG